MSKFGLDTFFCRATNPRNLGEGQSNQASNRVQRGWGSLHLALKLLLHHSVQEHQIEAASIRTLSLPSCAGFVAHDFDT